MPSLPNSTPSGLPVPPVVRPPAVPLDYARDLGDPGQFPFTRGIQPDMYRGRLWTMRQYAGFGTAAETNARFRLLLDAGQTGLSVAFDLPTQMGIDSDSARALGEVGRVGVAIDTVDDMHTLLADLPLDRVSTSMTINATASMLLAMYIVVAEERGLARSELSGTIQNDILKEYIARGTYIFPPEPSLALIADVFRFCADEVPNWNPISISGYHMREAGATAVQELAFTFANAVEYVQRAVAAGLDVNAFAPGSPSSSRPTTTCSRKWPSSAPRAGSTRGSCATGSAPTTGAAACASTRRRAASRSRPNSRSTTWCAWRCRRSPRCWAARSRCTPTGTTKRSPFPPSRRPRSPSARSRSSATSPAWR